MNEQRIIIRESKWFLLIFLIITLGFLGATFVELIQDGLNRKWVPYIRIGLGLIALGWIIRLRPGRYILAMDHEGFVYLPNLYQKIPWSDVEDIQLRMEYQRGGVTHHVISKKSAPILLTVKGLHRYKKGRHSWVPKDVEPPSEAMLVDMQLAHVDMEELCRKMNAFAGKPDLSN